MRSLGDPRNHEGCDVVPRAVSVPSLDCAKVGLFAEAAGGPGSSSDPGSRSQNAHPRAGAAWIFTPPPIVHLAAVPP